MKARYAVLVLCALSLAWPSGRADASMLSYVSDLVSTSVPNATSTHAIQFTTVQAIPAGGSFTITPDPLSFSFPASFNYTDVDVSVAAGGPYVDRTVAATASATEDGITVVPGTSGSITVALNSTTGIGAGEQVRVELGTNATYGTTGDVGIVNPAVPGAYHVRFVTYDAGSTRLDFGSTIDTIVLPVAVSGFVSLTPPGRFNGLPTGTIAANSAIIELSLETDEEATCRYATSSDVAYSSMTGTFTTELNQKFFYTNLTGFQNDTTYNYYVRCIDLQNTPNDDDYLISFTLAPTPSSNTSIVSSSPLNGSGGVGPYPGGSATLYQASVSFAGWTMPNATVTILKDGVIATNVQARSDGSFRAVLNGLERGAYSFQVYAQNSKAIKTGTFSTTLTLGQGSTNAISNILVPPSASFASDSIAVGEDALIVGESVPGSVVKVSVRKMNGDGTYSDPVFYTATTTKEGVAGVTAGRFEVIVPGKTLSKGSFVARVRATLSAEVESEYGKTLTLGVGEQAPAAGSQRADLNGDERVSLVDFSIMLSFWGTDEARADFNEDGIVNLADFSILLFNWTG